MLDHYQTLGVSRSADRETLHRAFRELSKKYHPDRFSESEREEAEKHYQQVVVAFNTLKDPKLRERYDKGMGVRGGGGAGSDSPFEQAKRYHQTGVQLYQKGQFEQAVESFKRANHFREDAETHYYKGMAESKVPTLKREASESFSAAIKLEPRRPKYVVAQIALFERYGLKARARGVAESGLKKFPGNAEIKEALKRLSEEDSGGSGSGLFGGLLGKK